ncbi:MAG TPA: XrtA system polysaccharide deacetylase [Planctomycetaceae bacterium]|nr:XrtA system polysaccharide deacetylase [Planctomycetaceae bacterium]
MIDVAETIEFDSRALVADAPARSHASERGNEAPENGKPHNGAPQDGAPRNGAPRNGASQNGHAALAVRVTNAFTVDVEDYFQVQAFAGRIDRRTWDDYPSRVVPNTHRVLKLLETHQVRGTFFVLGWVAERFPELVRDIQRAGHEIGCHTYWHRLIYEQTPEEFRDDLRRATRTLADITGESIVAFRAPCFSIVEKSLWAVDVLIDEGYQYDSSVFPVRHDTYGMPGAYRWPHMLHRTHGTLVEFPPSVRRMWKFNVPVAGGGYFRLLPLGFTSRSIEQINHDQRHPFMFYIHPWELDPDQPRLPAPSWRSRFRHYQNLGSTESKLDRLLAGHKFGTLTEALPGHLRS